MRKSIADLADQIIGYWHLEKKYHDSLKEWEGESCPSLSQMREAINKEYGVYPKMTAQEAQDIKKKYS